MEKYFIVTDENQLKKDYLDYNKNKAEVNKIIHSFFKKWGIEGDYYVAENDRIYIEASKSDELKFNNFLCKGTKIGLRAFKKSSKINKDWIKTLEVNNLKVLDRPCLGFYFENCYGRHSTRLFSINNTMYCSLNIKDNDYDFPVPNGMIEMKASEFFKIIEDNDN